MQKSPLWFTFTKIGIFYKLLILTEIISINQFSISFRGIQTILSFSFSSILFRVRKNLPVATAGPISKRPNVFHPNICHQEVWGPSIPILIAMAFSSSAIFAIHIRGYMNSVGIPSRYAIQYRCVRCPRTSSSSSCSPPSGI